MVDEINGIDSTVASMRRSRVAVVIADHNLSIVLANATAREMLAPFDTRGYSRLPSELIADLSGWIASRTMTERTSSALPDLLVHASHLEGDRSAIGLVVERFETRETLETASSRFGLSRRERDVIRLLLAGRSSSEIAVDLGIGQHTVGDYLKRIFAKTNVRSRPELLGKIFNWQSTRRSNG